MQYWAPVRLEQNEWNRLDENFLLCNACLKKLQVWYEQIITVESSVANTNGLWSGEVFNITDARMLSGSIMTSK